MMQLGGDHYPQMLAYCVTPWSSTLAKKHSPHQPTRLEAADDGPPTQVQWVFLGPGDSRIEYSNLEFQVCIFFHASHIPTSFHGSKFMFSCVSLSSNFRSSQFAIFPTMAPSIPNFKGSTRFMSP